MIHVIICGKCSDVILPDEITFMKNEHGKRYFVKKCRKCKAKEQKEWRGRNLNHVKEYKKKHRDDNRFSYALVAVRASARRGKYCECHAFAAEVENAFTGKCYVCGVSEGDCKRKLNLDHCHKTGKFRGWLCDNCNRALGQLQDSEERIENLLNYIRE